MSNEWGQAGGEVAVGAILGLIERQQRKTEREAALAEERRKEDAMIRRTKIARGWVPETVITPAPSYRPGTFQSKLLGKPITFGEGVEGIPITEEKLKPPEKSLVDVVKDIQAGVKKKAWEDYQAGRATEEQKKLIGVMITPRKAGVTLEEKRKTAYRKWMADLATKRVDKKGGLTERTIAILEKLETLPADEAWRKFYETEAQFDVEEADIIKSGLIRLFGGKGKVSAGIVPPAKEDLPTLMERIISGLTPGQYKRR